MAGRAFQVQDLKTGLDKEYTSQPMMKAQAHRVLFQKFGIDTAVSIKLLCVRT